MKDVKLIKIFISCPSDIKTEINSIRLIIQNINKTSGKHNNFILESLNWKDDTYSGIGEDAQEVITSQLEDEYDLLVGILWLKVGTATKRDKSGTIEEINRAIKNPDKNFQIYFKTATPDNLNEIDLDQLLLVNTFKQDLSIKGVLYKEFNTIQELESLFRANITNIIHDRILSKDEIINDDLIPIIKNKYSDITTLISEVENKELGISIDVFQTAEEINTYSNNMLSSLSSMTNNLTDLTSRMDNKTNELDKVKHIKDDRLRMSKQKTLINLFATELDDFNFRLSQETPKFSDNFLNLTNSYSNFVLFFSDIETEEITRMKNSASGFKDNLEFALQSSANLLRQMTLLPPVNFKLNKAKRETEIVLKDIIKVMLNGLKLWDEIIK